MRPMLILFSIILVLQCSLPMLSNQAEISEAELYDHISFLASDELEGRKPGSPQNEIAGKYIADHFKQIGLTPLGEDGYQYFEVINSVSLGDDNSLSAGDIKGLPGENYTPTAFSMDASVAAKLTFVGYGFQIENDSLKWDDYAGVETQDRWVMILRGNPEDDNESKYEQHISLRHKLLVARDNGAAGVIFVSGEKFDDKDELIDLRLDRNYSQASMAVIHTKRDLADQLLASSGKTIVSLENQVNEALSPQSFEVDTELSVNTQIIKNEATTHNVVAMLPGSDPVLKDEFIVVGAHHDHIGWGGKGSGSRRPDTTAVHNGADDNASGVAAVLEIAEQIALGKTAPKRSILFMTFGAEEMGLLGSKFFTSNPLIDIKSIKQMINLDMVGRMDPESKSVTIGGTGTAAEMADYLNKMAEGLDFEITTTPDGYGPSDHASFYIEDIPVLFFFTGITEEYHTPADDIETINIAGEKMIADFASSLVMGFASMDQAFAFQEAGPKGPPQGGKRGKVKMGIIPDFAAANADGFLLGGVVPGGPAAFAGMKKGDVMISLEGRSVKNIYDYMGRMADVKLGQRITVEVMRGDKKLIMIVQL